MTRDTPAFTLLDGGMGRLLLRLGAPFRLPEWSALALIEAPDFVARAHEAYVAAGAEIITTNSYGLVPHMIGEERFRSDARRLADLSGRLARTAADAAASGVTVAGSLPPAFASYRPEAFDGDAAPAIVAELVAGLDPHVDHWLIETQSATVEALTALRVAAPTGKPVHVSYTLKDEEGRSGPAELRSGEPVADAVAATIAAGATAILFNCSQPEVMQAAVAAARAAVAASTKPETPIGVYANAFAPEPPSDAPYAGISDIRADLGPADYVSWVRRWVASGASIVGGCCGIGPEHIAELRRVRDGGGVLRPAVPASAAPF